MPNTIPSITITPRLIVPSVPAAITFYCAAFDAKETERYTLAGGQVVHAEVRIGDAALTLADEVPQWGNLSPSTLGGSPLLLTLEHPDPDAICARAVEHGAQVVVSLQDQFYGKREGRIQDPFGHLWILSKQVETLSRDEVLRRMATWEDKR